MQANSKGTIKPDLRVEYNKSLDQTSASTHIHDIKHYSNII